MLCTKIFHQCLSLRVSTRKINLLILHRSTRSGCSLVSHLSLQLHCHEGGCNLFPISGHWPAEHPSINDLKQFSSQQQRESTWKPPLDHSNLLPAVLQSCWFDAFNLGEVIPTSPVLESHLLKKEILLLILISKNLAWSYFLSWTFA